MGKSRRYTGDERRDEIEYEREEKILSQHFDCTGNRKQKQRRARKSKRASLCDAVKELKQ